MRPDGKGPLESLYFTYPNFAAPALPKGPSHEQVVIVGGGPIGMTAALTLARYGVRSVILEKKETYNDGSRAICIARPSMHILERIGAVNRILDKALGWQFGRSYYRGTQIYRLEMPHSEHEHFMPMYNLQQQYIEAYLHDAIAAEPLIDMRWQSAVERVVLDGARANLTVRTPDGSYQVDAAYVLAADGARSAMRSHLGLRLKGANYEGRYVIADIRLQSTFPTERRAFFGARAIPGGTVLIHRQPDDIWRIDFQVSEAETNEDATSEPIVRQRVAAILAEIGETGPWDLEWWSIYTANTLALDDYSHGPVYFIGDSAHIVPIFGVRGLNNGLADAHNIGWKLAYVLHGRASPALLASYTPERRGATLDVFANASKSTRFMTPPSRGWAIMRDAALSLAVTNTFAQGFANPRQMRPYTYSDSPLTRADPSDGAFSSGPPAGAMATNVRLTGNGHLLTQCGDGFTVLAFLDATDLRIGAMRHLVEAVQRLTTLDPRAKLLIVTPTKIAEMPQHASIEHLDDPERVICMAYDARPGTIYLIRPDLHVAARWPTGTCAMACDALDQLLNRPPLQRSPELSSTHTGGRHDTAAV